LFVNGQKTPGNEERERKTILFFAPQSSSSSLPFLFLFWFLPSSLLFLY